MSVFRIPSLPADLVTKSDESALTVVQDIAIAGLKAEEVQEFAEGPAVDLISDIKVLSLHICATMATTTCRPCI